MATPHNEAKKGDIAKTVLMPGDPLRAKYIAEKFLDNAKLVTSVRNMFGFTGTYNGVPVTVMGRFLLWVQEWVCLLLVSIPMNYLHNMM